MQIDNIGKGG